MEFLSGKHFSIMDPQNVNTIIYQINEEEKELDDNSPRFTLERLKCREQLIGSNKKKTFFVDEVQGDSKQLVILSFGKDKVVVNNGVLDKDNVKISRKPMPVKFDTLYSEQESEYQDIKYTPNLKRPITIIDPETAEEVKPVLYIDEKTNEVKGKCKLKPYKSYFAFEIRQNDN